MVAAQILCRLSLNPESCILRAAGSFYRRGRLLLLFAKFVPGINSLAPPLAGSMKMPYRQFLWLDLTGASLYLGLYWTVGFLLSDLLGAVLRASTHSAACSLSWSRSVSCLLRDIRFVCGSRTARSAPFRASARRTRHEFSKLAMPWSTMCEVTATTSKVPRAFAARNA